MSKRVWRKSVSKQRRVCTCVNERESWNLLNVLLQASLVKGLKYNQRPKKVAQRAESLSCPEAARVRTLLSAWWGEHLQKETAAAVVQAICSIENQIQAQYLHKLPHGCSHWVIGKCAMRSISFGVNSSNKNLKRLGQLVIRVENQ